jgi:hypothetical protein
MQAQDTGLETVIRNVSALVRQSAEKSEAAALDAVARVEATLAGAQAKWNDAREIGSEVAGTLGHAGRTSVSGVAEFNGALGRYGKEAVSDTIDLGRNAFKAKSLKELVGLHIGYVTRRSQALFASVGELNAIAQANTAAAWSPFGEAVRRIVQKSTVTVAA